MFWCFWVSCFFVEVCVCVCFFVFFSLGGVLCWSGFVCCFCFVFLVCFFSVVWYFLCLFFGFFEIHACPCNSSVFLFNVCSTVLISVLVLFCICFVLFAFLFQDVPLLFLSVVYFVFKHAIRWFLCLAFSCGFRFWYLLFFFGFCYLWNKKHLSKDWKVPKTPNEICRKNGHFDKNS